MSCKNGKCGCKRPQAPDNLTAMQYFWNAMIGIGVGILIVVAIFATFFVIFGATATSAKGAEPEEGTYVGPSMPQIINQVKLDQIRASVPPIENEYWAGVLKSDDTLFYTEAEMPPAYQMNSGSAAYFVSTKYNISGDNQAPHFEQSKPDGNGGNANVEFPWRSPGGTDFSPRTANSSVKFLKLPRSGNGSFWPAVWYYAPKSNGLDSRFNAMCWQFPVETIFGEILYMDGPDGKLWPFEIRLRIRQPDYWDVEVLRPYPSYQEFREALAKVAPDQMEKFPKVVNVEFKTLQDTLHPRRGFVSAAAQHTMPPLPPEVAAELLKAPFKTSAGIAWTTTTDGKASSYAPVVLTGHSIVPNNYTGTYLGTNHFSCVKCHESTLMSARSFDQQRGWYGLVRGSDDGIFSFHPLTPNAISYSGGYTPPQFRDSFVTQGIFASFNPAIHTKDRYSSLSPDVKGPQQ